MLQVLCVYGIGWMLWILWDYSLYGLPSSDQLTIYMRVCDVLGILKRSWTISKIIQELTALAPQGSASLYGSSWITKSNTNINSETWSPMSLRLKETTLITRDVWIASSRPVLILVAVHHMWTPWLSVPPAPVKITVYRFEREITNHSWISFSTFRLVVSI